MDLKAAHARALADLEEAVRGERAAENVLAMARDHTSEMRSMAEALERALNLYEKPVGVTAERAPAVAAIRAVVTPSSAEGGPCLLCEGEDPSITNFSFNMLRHLGRPASTQEVRAAIARAGGKEYNEKGEDFNQDQVRSALQWLMKSSRVERVAPGTWRVARKPDDQYDVSTAEGAAVEIKTAENDPSRQDGVLNGATRFPQPAG